MEIVELLKKYDFSEYEARIYIALLKHSPMNGNNISLESGVPSSKVYQNLPRLINKGYIFIMNDGTQKSKRFYTPLPWSDLLEKLENSHQEDMDSLELHLNNIKTHTVDDWSKLYHVEGYEANIELLQQFIEQSEKSILFSGWNTEFSKVFEDIENAYKRNVSVVSLLFDEGSKEGIPWKHFHHHKGEYTSTRHLGELIAVFDNKKALILNFEDPVHGIVSYHGAFVNVAENYIRHDIYINRILTDFEEVIAERYGANLEKLLSDF